MDKSILFYDSGIGGLSTLAKTIQILPNEKYIYFADNLHVPYGNRTNQEICDLVYANILALLKRFKIKLIVIACNTATSLAIDFLRSKIQLPIIGIEPAVRVAEKKSKTKEILVIATKATICSKRYFLLSKSVSCKVHSCFLPSLASKIERGLIFGGLNIDAETNFIKKTLEKFPNIDQIVLGCTHYSLAHDKLKEQINISLSDGNFGVAKNIKRTLEKQNILRKEGFLNLQIVLSKNSPLLSKKYHEIIEKQILHQS